MVSVNSVYQKAQLVANKRQGTGYLSPPDFNLFAAMASDALLIEHFKVFQQTQTVTDLLQPFITKGNLMVVNGVAAFPSDYRFFVDLGCYKRAEFLAAYATCDSDEQVDWLSLKQVPIKLLDNSKFRVAQASEFMPPEYDYPIACIYDDGINCKPNDLGALHLDYLRAPAVPRWNWTDNPTTGLPEYNATGSVDFDWPASAENMLVFHVCKLFKVEVSDAELLGIISQLETANAGTA